MKPTKEQLFYFDLEWVPLAPDYFTLKMDYPELAMVFEHRLEKWNKEAENTNNKTGDEDFWWESKAQKYPEFNKIICMSYGYWNKGEKVVKSIYGHDEKKLLEGAKVLYLIYRGLLKE